MPLRALGEKAGYLPGGDRSWLAGYVPGTMAVAYLLAFGRWGSHLRIPGTPFYLTDLILGVSFLLVVRRHEARAAMRAAAPRLAPVLGLAALAVLRFAANGSVSLEALRDLAPYAYAAVCLLPSAGADERSVARTTRVLAGAMLMHLALVIFALVTPETVDRLPSVTGAGPASTILALRPDFDSAVLVVLAVILASRLLRRGGSMEVAIFRGIALLASLATIIVMQSRAGFMALVAGGLVLIASDIWPWFRTRSVRQRLAIAALTLIALAGGLPRSEAFQRLSKTPMAFGFGVDQTKPEADATGTAKARIESWTKSVRYTGKTPARAAFGVGFGPDFLQASGADIVLKGGIYTGVRAPHNYLINTYARMGVVGLLVLLAAFATVLRASTGLLRRPLLPLSLLAITLFLSMIVISIVGVVMESPFGAVPAFWAAGWIVNEWFRERRARVAGQIPHTEEATKRLVSG